MGPHSGARAGLVEAQGTDTAPAGIVVAGTFPGCRRRAAARLRFRHSGAARFDFRITAWPLWSDEPRLGMAVVAKDLVSVFSAHLFGAAFTDDGANHVPAAIAFSRNC